MRVHLDRILKAAEQLEQFDLVLGFDADASVDYRDHQLVELLVRQEDFLDAVLLFKVLKVTLVKLVDFFVHDFFPLDGLLVKRDQVVFLSKLALHLFWARLGFYQLGDYFNLAAIPSKLERIRQQIHQDLLDSLLVRRQNEVELLGRRHVVDLLD